MLYGIDISNYQASMNYKEVFKHVDFVICKMTEGIGYVDPMQQLFTGEAWRQNKCIGVYHFARQNSAKAEAQYFYKIGKDRDYWGYYLPILDWEENQSVEWVNEFVEEFYKLSGIYCWIYANPWRFNQGGVNENCARWIASYPSHLINPGLNADPGDVPETKGLVACWQFASDGKVKGYSGDLDLDHFYGDVNAWKKYCGIVKQNNSSILENNEYIVEIKKK